MDVTAYIIIIIIIIIMPAYSNLITFFGLLVRIACCFAFMVFGAFGFATEKYTGESPSH